MIGAHSGDRRRRPTLAELADPERLGELVEGLSGRQAGALGRLASILVEGGRAGADPAFALIAPGRIEVLGKHTDYAGGRSLTCATEQAIYMVAAARRDERVEIEDVGRSARAGLVMAAELDGSASDWTRYARTVVRRLARDHGEAGLRGADVALTSDLPAAAGMSSSSALVVALFQVLASVNRISSRAAYRAEIGSTEELAAYLGAVESGLRCAGFGSDPGVGTAGGSEDHTAILCSIAGRLGQYSYAPVRRERSIELPPGHTFVIASSGVRAEKTGGARAPYNRLSRAAAEVARVWRRATGGTEPDLATILAATPDAFERLRRVLAGADVEGLSANELLARLEHFRQESEVLVPQAGDGLERGDLAVFGLVVDRSQHLAGRLLGNQIPETVALAESARELGAAAASSFGAGFGGAVWALTEEADAEDFSEEWLGQYLESFPRRAGAARTLITGAGPPLREVEG